MDLLTFGKDKPVFDKTTLNKFCDLFQDYKEKNPGEQEFFLDLKKDLAIDNYSITDKELIAFFSKVTDEHATVIYESEFNEIMISFDKNYVISKSSVGKSFGKDMIDMNILDQKIKTILG